MWGWPNQTYLKRGGRQRGTDETTAQHKVGVVVSVLEKVFVCCFVVLNRSGQVEHIVRGS